MCGRGPVVNSISAEEFGIGDDSAFDYPTTDDEVAEVGDAPQYDKPLSEEDVYEPILTLSQYENPNSEPQPVSLPVCSSVKPRAFYLVNVTDSVLINYCGTQWIFQRILQR